MSMRYIREVYGLPIKRGMKVKVKAWDGWCEGWITSATHYVIVKPRGWPNARLRYHPTDYENIQYPF